VQNGYDQYNAGYEGYDCRKLQAFASLTDPPQYYICEIGTSDFSLKVMGRFDTINDVIATFRDIFKEHTGSTWNQRHGPIFYNPNKYCYIEYEPLSNDRKKKQPIKTWTFSEKKNSFVPVRKKTSKEQEQYISQEDLNVIYHYIGLPQAAQKKSITLKNPLFARVSCWYHNIIYSGFYFLWVIR
jgi:hypothetical protein